MKVIRICESVTRSPLVRNDGAIKPAARRCLVSVRPPCRRPSRGSAWNLPPADRPGIMGSQEQPNQSASRCFITDQPDIDPDERDKDREVATLLRHWQQGDDAALEDLLPLLYADLRKLAAAYMRRESPAHTLQPTALVSEAYFRLEGRRHIPVKSRAHFMAAAAEAMRRILVDHARRKRSEKRGGDRQRVTLHEGLAAERVEDVDLLALDQALDRLRQLDDSMADVVILRYFGGLTLEELAGVLGTSERSVSRRWTMARTWLKRELDSIDSDAAGQDRL